MANEKKGFYLFNETKHQYEPILLEANEILPDNNTLELNGNTMSLKSQDTSDKGKVFRVNIDGGWSLENVKEYEILETLDGVQGNDHTLYIVTPYHYELNNKVIDTSGSNDLLGYKILDASYVQVTNTTITINGVSYNFGQVSAELDTALTQAAHNAKIVYFSYKSEYENFNLRYKNNELSFFVQKSTNDTIYYKDAVTRVKDLTKMYIWNTQFEEFYFSANVFTDTPDLESIITPSNQTIYRITEQSYKHNSDELQSLTGYKLLNASWSANSNGIITGNGYKLNGSDYNITEEHDLKAYKINNISQVQATSSGIIIGSNTYSYGAVSTQFTNELFNATSMGYVSSVTAYEDPDTFNEWFNNSEIDFIITVIDYDNHSSYYKDSLTTSVISYNDITTTIINDWINNNNIEENNFNESDFFYYEVDSTNKGFDYRTTFSEKNNYQLYHNPTEQAGISNFIKIGENLDNYYNKTEIDTKLNNKQDVLTTEQLSAVNSGINTTNVAQIETNKNDIIDLKAKKVITDVNSLPAVGDPDTFYRISTNEGWKVNNSDYNISESHDLRLYKILNASQVSVSGSGITISGTNYNYGSVDSALQNSLMNASMSGYISYVMVSEDETTAIQWYNNNEIGFYISYIDDELTTLYNINTLNHTNAEIKLYQWINGHYIQIDDYTEIYNEINDLKTNKIDTEGTGLSKTGTTLNHSNSIAPQTTSKIGTITFDAQGHITGFTEKHIYMHSIGIKYSNVSNYYGTFNIFNENNSPINASGLATYLYSNGYNSAENQYPMSGSDDFVNRYCASSSGGSPTSSFTTTGIMTGIFSEDGSTLKYVYNRVSTRTLSMGTGSGTWVKEINCIKIL